MVRLTNPVTGDQRSTARRRIRFIVFKRNIGYLATRRTMINVVQRNFHTRPLGRLVRHFNNIPFRPHILLAHETRAMSSFVPITRIHSRLIRHIRVILRVNVRKSNHVATLIFNSRRSNRRHVLVTPIVNRFRTTRRRPVNVVRITSSVPDAVFKAIVSRRGTTSLASLLDHGRPFSFHTRRFHDIPRSFHLIMTKRRGMSGQSNAAKLPVAFLIDRQQGPSFCRS